MRKTMTKMTLRTTTIPRTRTKRPWTSTLTCQTMTRRGLAEVGGAVTTRAGLTAAGGQVLVAVGRGGGDRVDPMDPSSYSDAPKGNWSSGLDKAQDKA